MYSDNGDYKRNSMILRNDSDEFLNANLTLNGDNAAMLSATGGTPTLQRTQTAIYQQASGEKHVLFYPTSPVPSATSDEPQRSWSQGTASWATITNVPTSNYKMPNSNTDSATRSPKPKTEWTENVNRTGSGRVAMPLSAVQSTSNVSNTTNYNFKIGLYGWRKRCLYLLILGLLIMVIINLALTLWVLKVMEFSTEGMGPLRIVTGGIQLNGQAMVLDALIASTIRSRNGVPITIESSKNISLSTRDREGYLLNRLVLGNDHLECMARGFRITDDRGAVIFSADRKEVVLGTEVLRVNGVGGVVFEGSVQTPLVRAESAHDLRLESPTRSLELRAPVSIAIESRAGAIKAQCLTDMKLQSIAGAIRLESANVFMPNLPSAPPISRSTGSGGSSSGSSSSTENPVHKTIYQLCVCGDGKLFLAPSQGTCSTDESSRVCR